ncbi:MAG: class I SAM-dependent methyltransferase [Candidatus Krumholzibacteriia bacterium]
MFLDDLHAVRHGRVTELGCGDGRLAALLRERGVRPLLLDRRRPWQGTSAEVVADACRPPLRAGGWNLVLAASLLRHVHRPRPGEPVPRPWADLVAPGGSLWVFEDEPLSRPRPARNYRDLQGFLSRVVAGRRPLLSRREFAAACRDGRGTWRLGSQENRWPVDTAAVLQLLRGTGPVSAGEAERLCTAIASHGLSYGRFWWARWSPEVR